MQYRNDSSERGIPNIDNPPRQITLQQAKEARGLTSQKEAIGVPDHSNFEHLANLLERAELLAALCTSLLEAEKNRVGSIVPQRVYSDVEREV